MLLRNNIKSVILSYINEHQHIWEYYHVKQKCAPKALKKLKVSHSAPEAEVVDTKNSPVAKKRKIDLQAVREARLKALGKKVVIDLT